MRAEAVATVLAAVDLARVLRPVQAKEEEELAVEAQQQEEPPAVASVPTSEQPKLRVPQVGGLDIRHTHHVRQ